MNMSATARTRGDVAIQIPSATPTTSAMKKPRRCVERVGEIDRELALGEHVEQRDDDLRRARQIEPVHAGQDRGQFPADEHEHDRAPAEHARIVEQRRRRLRAGGAARGTSTERSAMGWSLMRRTRSPTIARITSSRSRP
jgi:hypothetical protein